MRARQEIWRGLKYKGKYKGKWRLSFEMFWEMCLEDQKQPLYEELKCFNYKALGDG